MQSSLQFSLLFFCVYMMTILIGLRFIKNISASALVCALACIVYLLALVVAVIDNLNINFFSFSSLYWFLTLCMLMIFGAVYKSISLKIMLQLLSNPNKSGDYGTILNNYIKEQSYANRIDILFSNNWIEKSDDSTFMLAKKGDALARKVWTIQRVFSIKESG